MLVLDEPVSALDVSIQAGVVNLLEDLQDRLGLAYLFIAHDLSVVRHISDEIAVMYLGKIVEHGLADDVYTQPAAPVHAGVAVGGARARPGARTRRARGSCCEGDVPSPVDPPSRLPVPHALLEGAGDLREEEPPLDRPRPGHPVACHFAEIAAEII